MGLRFPFEADRGPVVWGAAVQAVVGIPLFVLFGWSAVLLTAVLAGMTAGGRTRQTGPLAINGAIATLLGFLCFIPIIVGGYAQGISAQAEISTGDIIFFTAIYSGVVVGSLGVATGLIGYVSGILAGVIRKQIRIRISP